MPGEKMVKGLGALEKRDMSSGGDNEVDEKCQRVLEFIGKLRAADEDGDLSFLVGLELEIKGKTADGGMKVGFKKGQEGGLIKEVPDIELTAAGVKKYNDYEDLMGKVGVLERAVLSHYSKDKDFTEVGEKIEQEERKELSLDAMQEERLAKEAVEQDEKAKLAQEEALAKAEQKGPKVESAKEPEKPTPEEETPSTPKLG